MATGQRSVFIIVLMLVGQASAAADLFQTPFNPPEKLGEALYQILGTEEFEMNDGNATKTIKKPIALRDLCHPDFAIREAATKTLRAKVTKQPPDADTFDIVRAVARLFAIPDAAEQSDFQRIEVTREYDKANADYAEIAPAGYKTGLDVTAMLTSPECQRRAKQVLAASGSDLLTLPWEKIVCGAKEKLRKDPALDNLRKTADLILPLLSRSDGFFEIEKVLKAAGYTKMASELSDGQFTLRFRSDKTNVAYLVSLRSFRSFDIEIVPKPKDVSVSLDLASFAPHYLKRFAFTPPELDAQVRDVAAGLRMNFETSDLRAYILADFRPRLSTSIFHLANEKFPGGPPESESDLLRARITEAEGECKGDELEPAIKIYKGDAPPPPGRLVGAPVNPAPAKLAPPVNPGVAPGRPREHRNH